MVADFRSQHPADAGANAEIFEAHSEEEHAPLAKD